jgi:hypothetical protein
MCVYIVKYLQFVTQHSYGKYLQVSFVPVSESTYKWVLYLVHKVLTATERAYN